MANNPRDDRAPITDDQIVVSRRAALRRIGGAAAAVAFGGIAAACSPGGQGGSGSTERATASFTKAGAAGSDLDETRQADDKGDQDVNRTADSKATDTDVNRFADPKDFDVTRFADPGGQGQGGPGTTDADFTVSGDFKDSDFAASADSKVRDADANRTADLKGDNDTNTVNDPVGSQG